MLYSWMHEQAAIMQQMDRNCLMVLEIFIIVVFCFFVLVVML